MHKLGWALACAGAFALVACADRTDLSSPRRLSRSGDLVPAGTPITGSIKTTLSACQVVNGNVQYTSKLDVYVNGGGGTLGPLAPDGDYFVRVTAPDGSILGTSPTADYSVVSGVNPCLQVWSLVNKQSDGTQGYDNTANPGGEYKLAVCADAQFTPALCKYDNFKVRENACLTPNCLVNPFATVTVDKFYDANANGVQDATELSMLIVGWPMTLNELVPGPDATKGTPASWNLLDPGTYSITEGVPTGTGQAANWFITYKGTTGLAGSNGLSGSVRLSVATASDRTIGGIAVLAGGSESRLFGNVCIGTGSGSGKTRGFWSNSNGASVLNHVGSLLFADFQLPNNTGGKPTGATWTVVNTPFTTTSWGTVSSFQTWIGSANSGSNLSYQLGSQAAAMYLNINVGSPASGGWVTGATLNNVDPNSIIYAPGTASANALGFATVGAIMTEVKGFLNTNYNVPTGSMNAATRTLGSALIAALDGANNNVSFVQPSPLACSATFTAQ